MNAPLSSNQEGRFSDAALKHLEFIQGVISRLATSSFILKGWSLTVSGAFFGYSASHFNWPVATVGLLSAVAFWFLDAYYLRQERLYRIVYDKAARRDSEVPLFSMDTAAYKESAPWLDVMLSVTLSTFYGALMAVGLVLVIASILHHT